MDIRKYNKIILIGAAGSGKSYFAKELSKITGHSLIHLDCEFWKPNWIKTPKEEWIEKQNDFIKGDKWIIDGNYNSSMELRFTAADLIIFLDINRVVCLWSVFKRHGKKRTDLPEYLDEVYDKEFFEFLKWIWTYPKTGRARVLKLHDKYPDKKFLVFKRRKMVNRFLKDIL